MVKSTQCKHSPWWCKKVIKFYWLVKFLDNSTWRLTCSFPKQNLLVVLQWVIYCTSIYIMFGDTRVLIGLLLWKSQQRCLLYLNLISFESFWGKIFNWLQNDKASQSTGAGRAVTVKNIFQTKVSRYVESLVQNAIFRNHSLKEKAN